MAIDPIFGSLIGAGANLLGGIISGGNTRKANEEAGDLAAHNLALQRDALYHGTTFRARDAMAAYKETGIHPLQLLGVSSNVSPVTGAFIGDTSLGEGLGKAGQSIERGVHASADREVRRQGMAATEALNKLAIERGGLENEILRLRLASEAARLTQSPSVGKPLVGRSPDVVDGQNTNTELRSPLKFVKDEGLVTKFAPSGTHTEPVLTPSVGWTKNSDGSYSPIKAKAFAERTEDDFWNTAKHFVANTLRPMFSPNSVSPPFPARYGYRWYVDWKGDWHYQRDRRVER